MVDFSTRSLLVVPLHDEEKIHKARNLGADKIIFDLEDGVPEGEKEQAIENSWEHVTEEDVLRVLPFGHELFDESIDATVVAGSTIFPKVDLSNVYHYASLGCPNPGFLAEEPSSIRALWHLVESGGGSVVEWLVLGAMDLSCACDVEVGSPVVSHFMSDLSLVAAHLHVPLIDSPCLKRSPRAAQEESVLSRSVGYTGKVSCYPGHIDKINKEYGQRKSIIKQELGVFEVEGRIYGPPIFNRGKNAN